MLLTKEVEVIPSGKMIKYYKDKGYNAKYHEPLIVKVEDLPSGSHARVKILCDMCKENIAYANYYDYNKVVGRSGEYVCKRCSYEKIKSTNLSRYGVENYGQTKECREKMTETKIRKYGENYGSYIMEKASKTFYERTGYKRPSQSPEVRRKMIKTSIERYGCENPAQSSEVKEKMAKTCLERYNCLRPAQSPTIKEKIAQTLYRNGSVATSKQQLYLFNLYNQNEHVFLNYPISHFNADICIPEEKLDIELDCGGHNLSVKIGQLTQEEFDQKEIMRNNIIKREGYKQMRIISTKDLLPSDAILLQMLSETKQYFINNPSHSWIEYDIDTSTLRNAENKEGVLYDFGELRKINKVTKFESIA